MSERLAGLEQHLKDRTAHMKEVERRIPKHAADGKAPNKDKYERYNEALKRAKQEIKDLEAAIKEEKGR